MRWTFTETLIINAFICDECKQIYEAERSYEKKITRNAIVTLLFCFSILLLAALAFAIFVLRANSNNIPIFFIYMSAILIIGIMLFLLIRNIKVKKEKTTRPHVDLIKKYQHPCQPVLIDRMQKEDDWTLRIYNEQYADAFEKMNMGNHGLTKISH